MVEETQTPLVKIESSEEVENTFVDDDDDSSDINNEPVYTQFSNPEKNQQVSVLKERRGVLSKL